LEFRGLDFGIIQETPIFAAPFERKGYYGAVAQFVEIKARQES
jgi:hypothetical protein